MRVLDYSAGFPGAAAIKRAGYGGAVRYIGFPERRKCTTRSEVADFLAHDLDMAFVHENTATDWRQGFAGGQVAAQRSRDHLRQLDLWPQVVYFAVDQDVVTASEFAIMVAYLNGAASELGAQYIGVYGEHDVCARASASGVAKYFWQTRAWSGTPVKYFAGRHLYQYADQAPVGGITCDINEVVQDDYGQWNRSRGMELDDMVELSTSIREKIPTDNKAISVGGLLGLAASANGLHAKVEKLEASQTSQSTSLKALTNAVSSLASAITGLQVAVAEAARDAVQVALAEGTVKVDVTVQNNTQS